MKRDYEAEKNFPLLAELGELIETLEALREYRDVDVQCVRCGKREHRVTRDPKSPGLIEGVCNDCLEG